MNDTDTLIMRWQQAKAQLDNVKAEEATLRQQIADTFFKDVGKGTHRHDLGNGYKLKFVGKLNYKLDKKLITAALDEIDNSGSDGSFITERLVKYDPSLSVSEYERLSDARKKIIDRALTITPGAPTLEIEEPRVKK